MHVVYTVFDKYKNTEIMIFCTSIAKVFAFLNNYVVSH